MNKLLQQMIQLGDVSDKYLTSLPKGYSVLPKFQGAKGSSQVGKRWYSSVVPDSIENYLEDWFAEDPKKAQEIVATAFTEPEDADEISIDNRNQLLKAMIAYNHGSSATVNKLNTIKQKNINIYGNTDWVNSFSDDEARKYGKKIVLDTDEDFNKEYDSAVQVNPYVKLYDQYYDRELPDYVLDKMKKQAYLESRFRPDAYNVSGATGFTQVKPIALKEFNRLTGKNYKMKDLYNPEIAIEVQYELMKHLYNRPWAMKKSDDDFRSGGQLPIFQNKGEFNQSVDFEENNARLAAVNSNVPFNYEAWLDSKFGKGPTKARLDYENAKRASNKQLASQTPPQKIAAEKQAASFVLGQDKANSIYGNVQRGPNGLPSSGAVEPVAGPIEYGLFGPLAGRAAASALKGVDKVMNLPATISGKAIPWLTGNNLMNSAVAAGAVQQLSDPNSEIRSNPDFENVTNAGLSMAGIPFFGAAFNAGKIANNSKAVSDELLEVYKLAQQFKKQGLIERELPASASGFDKWLQNQYNQRALYRVVDVNPNVMSDPVFRSNMTRAGKNADNPYDVAEYMGTTLAPSNVINRGRRSGGHQELIEGTDRDILYFSEDPRWLGPRYGGGNPYYVKVFADPMPQGLQNQVLQLRNTSRLRKNFNRNFPEFDINNVPSGVLFEDNYLRVGNNPITPIIGNRGERVREASKVISGKDFDRLNNKFFKKGGLIVSSRGQWDYPGQDTIVPTPNGRITMQGVPYPVYGQDETGYGQIMYPGAEYTFPGEMVYEKPLLRRSNKAIANKYIDLDIPKSNPDYGIYINPHLAFSDNHPSFGATVGYNRPRFNVYGKYMEGSPEVGLNIRFEDGGQSDDDREMLDGVADMLRRVKDAKNRKEIANYMMRNFRDENVNFTPKDFLASSNVFADGGQMIRRADGSYSQRGMWDNIRDNKGSGKKPTKAMLEQERKIKAKYR